MRQYKSTLLFTRFLKIHTHQPLLQHSHNLCHKRLQMEYNLRSHPNPVLVERTPLDDGYQLESEGLEDRGGRNTVGEKIVEFGADLENAGWGVFVHYLFGNLGDEGFPIGWGNGGRVCYFVTVREGLADVPEQYL